MAQVKDPHQTKGKAHIDVSVSGIESVTDIGGGQVRVTYYVNRPAENGAIERMILPHAHIMPICAVTDAIGKGMCAIGRKVVAGDDRLTVMAH